MNNHQNYNINIELFRLNTLVYLNLDYCKNKLDFSCKINHLIQIKIIDDSVLYFQFENIDILLDIKKTELINLLKLNER